MRPLLAAGRTARHVDAAVRTLNAGHLDDAILVVGAALFADLEGRAFGERAGPRAPDCRLGGLDGGGQSDRGGGDDGANASDGGQRNNNPGRAGRHQVVVLLDHLTPPVAAFAVDGTTYKAMRPKGCAFSHTRLTSLTGIGCSQLLRLRRFLGKGRRALLKLS